MTNIEAAFLYEQLNDINCILGLKQTIFNNYKKLLEDEISDNKITLQLTNENCENANWMFAIRFMNNRKSIHETDAYFIENGVEIRPFFYPYYRHAHLDTLRCNDTTHVISEKLNTNIIMLPSYPELCYEEQEYIAMKIRIFVNDE